MQTALQTKWHYLFIDTEALNLERPNIRFTTTTNWQQFILNFLILKSFMKIFAEAMYKNLLVTIQLLWRLFYLFARWIVECVAVEPKYYKKKYITYRANTIYKIDRMKKQFVMIFCVWIPTAMNLFCFKFENKGNMKRWSLILWCDKRSKLNSPVKLINNGCVPTYTKHGLKLILHEEIKSCVYKKDSKEKKENKLSRDE